MYVLLALSVASIAVMVERWWFFRKRGTGGEELCDALCDLLEQGDRTEAEGLLRRHDSIEAEVLLASLRFAQGGPDALADGHRRRDDQAPARARERDDLARHAGQQRALRRPPRDGHRRHRRLRRSRRGLEQDPDGQGHGRDRRGAHRDGRRPLRRHPRGRRLQLLPEEDHGHRRQRLLDRQAAVGAPCGRGHVRGRAGVGRRSTRRTPRRRWCRTSGDRARPPVSARPRLRTRERRSRPWAPRLEDHAAGAAGSSAST